MVDLSFVIVNYNTRDLLLDCIASIYATVSYLTFEILLVDNNSSDDSVKAVSESFPEVVCFVNNVNKGFARANNIAIREAAGKYVVLLNTDTLLTDFAIAKIHDFMEEHHDVGICGGQLLNADGSLQNSIANYPTLATELLNKSLLRRLFPQKYPGKNQVFKSPTEVETIIGACMVVSSEAIKKVGMLNESYFFYFE
ncbi:MAG: glycosyltransferase family 2 protein, partial [Desulfuromonadales bacterium]|nr:glycosyltransferase family 2 protein [Desulfuromonadales bacterium]